MKLIRLKIIWSIITKPKCYGHGGNLSSMNCGKCTRIHACCSDKNQHMEPQVFWKWAKPGEAYKVSKLMILFLNMREKTLFSLFKGKYQIKLKNNSDIFKVGYRDYIRQDGIVYRNDSSSFTSSKQWLKGINWDKKLKDSWKHHYIIRINDRGWYMFYVQAEPCTLHELPEYKSCSNCPDDCTEMGLPRYSDNTNGDGTPHIEEVIQW